MKNAVFTDHRTCFALAYFATEAEAKTAAEKVEAAGNTYNGGFYHGCACGRAPQFDHDSKEHGKKLFAVSF